MPISPNTAFAIAAATPNDADLASPLMHRMMIASGYRQRSLDIVARRSRTGRYSAILAFMMRPSL